MLEKKDLRYNPNTGKMEMVTEELYLADPGYIAADMNRWMDRLTELDVEDNNLRQARDAIIVAVEYQRTIIGSNLKFRGSGRPDTWLRAVAEEVFAANPTVSYEGVVRVLWNCDVGLNVGRSKTGDVDAKKRLTSTVGRAYMSTTGRKAPSIKAFYSQRNNH